MNETPPPQLHPRVSPDRFASPVPVPLPATPGTPPNRPPIRTPQVPPGPRTPPPLVVQVRPENLPRQTSTERSGEYPWEPVTNEEALNGQVPRGAVLLADPQAATDLEVPPTASKRRDKVLYVRVNIMEKTKIVSQAKACDLSISRYLTRLSLDKRPPPLKEERQQLEGLLMMFKRLDVSISRLHAEATSMRLFSVMPQMEEDFDAALETTRGLIRELGKRLS